MAVIIHPILSIKVTAHIKKLYWHNEASQPLYPTLPVLIFFKRTLTAWQVLVYLLLYWLCVCAPKRALTCLVHSTPAPRPKCRVYEVLLDKQANRPAASRAPQASCHPGGPAAAHTSVQKETSRRQTYCGSVSSNLHAAQLKPRPVRIQLCRPEWKEHS